MANEDVDAYIKRHSTPAPESDVDAYIKRHTSSDVSTNGGSFIEDAKDLGSRAVNAIGSKTGDVHDTLAGYTQGALMGGGDELGGLLTGAMDKAWGVGHNISNAVGSDYISESPSQVNARLKDEGFKGDIGPTTFGGMYREGQQATQKDFNEAEERSPWLFTAGNLAGAVGTGMATGGLAAKGLASVAPKLAQSAPMLAQIADPALAAGKWGKIGAKAAQIGALGAAEGIPAGFLGSSGTIEGEPGQLGMDTLKGAATGSALGAGISLASDVAPIAGKYVANKLGGKIDDLAKEYPLVDQALTSFKEGTSGNGFIGDSARQRIQKGSNEVAFDAQSRLMKAQGKLGDQIGNSLDSSSQAFGVGNYSGAQSALDDLYKSVGTKPSIISNDKGANVIASIDKLRAGTLSPREAWELRDALKKSFDPNDVAFNNTTKSVQNSLKGMLDTVPGFKQSNEMFNKFATNGPENFIEKGLPDDVRKKWLSENNNPEADIYSKMRQLMNNLGRPGTTSDPAREIVDNMGSNLSKLDAQYPGVFKNITGTTTEDLMDGITHQGKLEGIRKSIAGQHGFASNSDNLLGALVGYSRQGSLVTSNLAGKAAGKVSRTGNKIYSLGNDAYKAMANQMSSNKATTHLGKALQQAIETNDLAKRNAVLFSILQNPTTRLQYAGDEQDQ